MTLEEAIKHCEEVAEKKEKQAKECHDNQVRKCEVIPFAEMDYTRENECLECAEEHRQLAEWLRELKDYKDRQDLINKSWQELIHYKEGIEKIKIRSQSYRERGETILASGMEQALDILEEVNADEG